MIKLAVIVALMMTVASGGLSAGDSDGRKCLAEAMYYEARDQGWRGMLAVGIVIQNRVSDARYPETACGATHYHATWVQPPWTTELVRRKQIGGHIFYAKR
jgi:spore germination cell wall hydrolase CwlJ-like protein